MNTQTRMEAQQGICGLGGEFLIFVDGAPTPEEVASALFWLTLFVWLIFWPIFVFEWLWTRMRRGVRWVLWNATGWAWAVRCRRERNAMTRELKLLRQWRACYLVAQGLSEIADQARRCGRISHTFQCNILLKAFRKATDATDAVNYPPDELPAT